VPERGEGVWNYGFMGSGFSAVEKRAVGGWRVDVPMVSTLFILLLRLIADFFYTEVLRRSASAVAFPEFCRAGGYLGGSGG
jgi:hypothetical protein